MKNLIWIKYNIFYNCIVICRMCWKQFMQNFHLYIHWIKLYTLTDESLIIFACLYRCRVLSKSGPGRIYSHLNSRKIEYFCFITLRDSQNIFKHMCKYTKYILRLSLLLIPFGWNWRPSKVWYNYLLQWIELLLSNNVSNIWTYEHTLRVLFYL